jgi:hypothetical protein
MHLSLTTNRQHIHPTGNHGINATIIAIISRNRFIVE